MSSNNAVLDAETAATNFDNDLEMYHVLIDCYLEDAPGLIAGMSAAVDAHDLETVFIKAHSLKSTSRTIGGMRLGNLSEELESLSKERSDADYHGLIDTVNQEFSLLKIELLKLKNA